MKNLLSENMMRFGTKNLSESQRRKLTFESIMQTIEEYNLQFQVHSKLTEQLGSAGPIKTTATQNWDSIPNVQTIYKQNPDLTKIGKSIGEDLKSADGDNEEIKRAVERLRNYCDIYRKNYAKEPDRANYYVAALFAVVDKYISDYTEYNTMLNLIQAGVSGGDLKYIASVLRTASGGKVDISIPYGGVDNLLDFFGL